MPKINTAITPTYYAYDTSNGSAKTGDVANHTMKVIADGTVGAVAAAPAEVDAALVPGLYKVVVANDENTGAMMALHGKSTTSNIVIVPVFWTCESNVAQVSGTNQTANDNGADLNTLITQIGTGGDGLTAIASVGAVAGAVGSVSGAVGSVAAAVETDTASRTASKADVSGLSTFNAASDEVDIGAVKGGAVAGVNDFKADLSTLVSEHAALAVTQGQILGSGAGKSTINAAGDQILQYDRAGALLVTLDRTGTGPYTWTPTWV